MKLKHNLGWADKLVRYGIAAILVSLHLSGKVTGTYGLITLGLAATFLLTGIFRVCPIYFALGVSTSKPDEKMPGKYEH